MTSSWQHVFLHMLFIMYLVSELTRLYLERGFSLLEFMKHIMLFKRRHDSKWDSYGPKQMNIFIGLEIMFAISSAKEIYTDLQLCCVLVWRAISWWRHQMETFSALLAICAGNSPVTGEFPAQRPVTRNFDIFVDLRLNKRLSKQWWGWWSKTPSRPLWRHSNVLRVCVSGIIGDITSLKTIT